ncbi:Glucoamylase I, partial [Pseudocercospora fuligena]
VKKAEWQAQYEDYILENFDFNEPRITAGAQRWQDARLSRRQAVQGTTNYVQTVTSSFVGTDGYTTVPYATNGQQCSSISRNMNVVYSPNGIQYLYICGGAVSGNINWSYQAPGWSSCMPQCDTSNNCTGLSYNSGGLYGMQNAAGSGSISQLGSWSTANALTLSASNYTTDNPVWYITVSIPAGTYFEYKYLRQESNGALTWEDGSNRLGV